MLYLAPEHIQFLAVSIDLLRDEDDRSNFAARLPYFKELREITLITRDGCNISDTAHQKTLISDWHLGNRASFQLPFDIRYVNPFGSDYALDQRTAFEYGEQVSDPAAYSDEDKQILVKFKDDVYWHLCREQIDEGKSKGEVVGPRIQLGIMCQDEDAE